MGKDNIANISFFQLLLGVINFSLVNVFHAKFIFTVSPMAQHHEQFSSKTTDLSLQVNLPQLTNKDSQFFLSKFSCKISNACKGSQVQ